MFRDAFAASPCTRARGAGVRRRPPTDDEAPAGIWCPQADLKVLQMSHVPGSDTVFVERLDQFLIDGVWLRVPNCGYVKVENGKIKLWKDYWWCVESFVV